MRPGGHRARRPAALVLALGAGLAPALGGCGGGSGPQEPAGAGALSIAAVEGAGARAPAGTALPEGPAVEVRDGEGAPVAGVRVRFAVREGGGRVSPASAVTDASGRAGAVWVLGPDPGARQALEAGASGSTVRIEALAEAPASGGRYEGRRGYAVWLAGDLPVILSAPHGGSDEPAEIPDRTSGVTAQDRRTMELALAIRAAVLERTGGLAHVVLTRLHRRKLDPNREIREAAGGDPEAERAWREYHAFLEAARSRVEARHGAGLVLDVHGHAHPVARVELGYLLSASELALPDSALEAGGLADESSVRELAVRSPAGFAELLRGGTSLGGLLDDRGYAVVPGPAAPDPGGEPYFTGGYVTRRHGSVEGGPVSAIQLEHPWPGVRETPASRSAYAGALADALLDFFPAHFGRELAGAAPGTAPGRALVPVSRSRAPSPPEAGAGSRG